MEVGRCPPGLFAPFASLHDVRPSPNVLSAQLNRVGTEAPRANVLRVEGEVIRALSGAGAKTEIPALNRGAASRLVGLKATASGKLPSPTDSGEPLAGVRRPV